MRSRYPSRALIFFFIFISVSILISFFTGYVWRNSRFILTLSLPSSYYFYKKYPYEFDIPRNVYILTLLMFVLTAGPLLMLTPYYPGSADAIGATIMRVLGDKIPDTYAPYSNLKLTYQIGFHLFAKLFVDLLPFVPDYLILWFFAVLFASLHVILLYQFGKVFFGSTTYGEWLAILVIGTKTMYQYTFWGEAPLLLGLDLFIIFFILFIRRNGLCYLLFPTIFTVHPFTWFMTVFIVGTYSLLNRKYLKGFLRVLPTFLLIMPFVVKTYFAYSSNVFAPESYPYAVPFSLHSAVKMIVALVLWLGPVPTFFAFGGVAMIIRKMVSGKKTYFVTTISVASLFCYILLYFPGYMWYDKIFAIINFSGLLLAGIYLETSEVTRSRFVKHIKIIIIILGILTYFASAELTNMRSGSKVSKDEVELAKQLYKFDPSLETTIFLSPGGGWMAHMSNKIPYDASVGHFVLPYAAQAIRDEGWEELDAKRETQKHIYKTGCIECIYELGVTYVVINREYTKIELSESPVLQYKDFYVYRITP